MPIKHVLKLASIISLSAALAVATILIYTQAPRPAASQVPSRAQVIDRIMERTVKVETSHGSGTGNLVTRVTADGRRIHLVLTAAHVVESLRVITPGQDGPYIKWAPCQVLIPSYQNGVLVATFGFAADVIQYSNKDTGQDLAVLLVQADTITSATTDFYLDDQIPPVGQDIYHVGCMFGDFHSFTTGVLSQHGRATWGRLFDQVTTIIYPGSSGGGLYLPDGRYIGMASLLRASAVGYITPIRAILKWADKVEYRWMFDPKLRVPSWDVISKLPIEHDGSALPIRVEAQEP